ncbi:TonB-dependent siderophore receptor [Massilia sp. CCM 9210]|uniref:TonB-dependent receptor n=1 Tax=Massilia scottii TaxID=3057166 RepID=UPI002796446C|nr:TonB-dependent siderophore receptor [Massilia sp. CCM 9210]MDQ1814878.1 TonB-dependent siderophore receptor [Massilia sp. CCM 9210]
MKLRKLPCALLCLYSPLVAYADDAPPPMQVVVIDSARAPAGSDSTDIGSRLDLTLRETPASVEVINRDLIEVRGARSLDEAVRGAVGITQGGNATSPSQTSSRGFSAGFVSYLYDGSRIAVPTMSARTQDTWNFERIEVLKGPASLMSGDGAIGGAINFVTKRPERALPASEAMLSYGSFNTWRLGAGINRPLGETSAVRIDYSHQQSDGYIDRNKQRYDSLTLATTSALTRDITLDLSLDLLSDNVKAYQGSPLVPRALATDPVGAVSDAGGRVIDRRLAFKNYNVDDAVMESDSAWARAKLTWKLAPDWTLRNELSYYTADRSWRNAESYTFSAPRQIVRDLVGVTHDHQVFGNRLDLSYTGNLAGLKHRFAAGAEYSKTRFATGRSFSNGAGAANAALTVDLFDPSYGSYEALSANAALYTGAGNRTNFSTSIPTVSLYLEDAVWVTDKWTVVAGLRQDRVKLGRRTADLNTGVATAYAQTYDPRSLRFGTVYAFDKDISVYAQHTSASAPVGSGNLLLLSAANAAFELSKGTQSEIGIKQSLFGGTLDTTLALYRIELDNILSRDAAVPTLTVNSGKQSSRGVELAAAWRPTRQVSINGNVALLDAQFDQLLEAGKVSRAGNLPPNVAKKTGNLWVDYKVDQMPLKLGAALNYTGERYTNNANTIRMNAFTTADVYASWRLGTGDLTLRVRNLGDKLYAGWSGANVNSQVILGAPRSADLTWHARF